MGQEKVGNATVCLLTCGSTSFESKGHSEHNEELFPRLPNEITFGQIVPKLPWNTFHNLAAVSRAWRKAILDHRIHDARVHFNSTDTLIVHGHDCEAGSYEENGGNRTGRIAVYSFRDRLCYDLPPIPGHYRGVPESCACVSLDGRIYVLGGAVEDSDPCAWGRHGANSSSKVYVLDLAGASHRNECASMERGRQEFGCAILDGKIYVCGGTNNVGPARGAEVYNPKGKFHRIREEGISVLEMDGHWTCLKLNEFPGGTRVLRIFALEVYDELLARVERYDENDPEDIAPAIY